MAVFIPSIPNNFNHSGGEESVFKSLRALNNDYTVFHSLSWVGAGNRTLGEADFVITHPNKGVLIVEVKAGEIIFNGAWYQRNFKTGIEKRIDPFNQARRNQYEIEERLARTVPDAVLLSCYCVWFPSCAMPAKAVLPMESPRELVLDETSLNMPETDLANVYAYWSRKKRSKTSINADQYKRIINSLCPYFHIVPRLRTRLNEIEQYYIQLTKQQVALLNFLEEQKTAVIHGLAGTGKTVLAVEKAKLLAEHGESVLLLCYNSFLRDFLRQNNNIPNVVIHNAHSLASGILRDYVGPLESLLPAFIRYLEENDLGDWPYRNIIVDEGQDLDERLLNNLSNICRMKNGCCYVFYDRNQYVLTGLIPAWIDRAECRLVLHKNCRNTSAIFQTSCSILGLADIANQSDFVPGVIPTCSLYSTENDLSRIIARFINAALNEGIAPENIVVLTAASHEQSWVKSGAKFSGIPLSEQRKPGSILFTTIRKFKGLEAEAILIIDASIRRFTNEEYKRLLYVGCSRARYILELAILEDIMASEYSNCLRAIDPSRNVPKNRKGLERLFNVKLI